MAIAESVGRLGATLVAMVQTRLELAAVEVEEESQRLLGYLLLSLLALFLFGIALLLLALLVIVICWDSYRIAAVAGMAVLYGAAGALVASKVKTGFAGKPRLLEHTFAEIRKDISTVQNARQAND